MKVIPNLDIHITHKCNFSCDNCSHFMNQGFDYHVPLDECKTWMSLWSKKVLPKNIGLLGGEPFLNKDLKDYCIVTRNFWPDTDIEVVTNAFLIHLQPDVFETLIENKIILSISFHSNDKNYINIMRKKVEEIKKWKDRGLLVRKYDSYNYWNKVYDGNGSNIMPFEDNDPESSWNNCPTGQTCFQLHRGKIWKCAPLAYLPMMKEKYSISEKWDPYLEYTPLSPDCSNEEMEEFFNRGSEKYCSMCPSKSIHFKKQAPFNKITLK